MKKKTEKGAQEALESKLTKSIETFSLNSPLEIEEGKKLITLPNLEIYNSVYDINAHIIIFAIYSTGYWKDGETFRKRKKTDRTKIFKSNYVTQVKVNEKGLRLNVELNAYQLTDFEDYSKRNKFHETLETMEQYNIQTLVFGISTYIEIEYMLHKTLLMLKLKSVLFPHGLYDGKEKRKTQ